MKKIALLLLIPALALANDPNPSRPGSTRTQATSGSTSVAGASNAGNSQDITFNQGGAGHQRIDSTPGISMYTPPASDCYVSVSASVGVTGVGVGVTPAFLSRPCNLRTNATTLASVAVANYNVGNKDEAKQAVNVAQNMLMCGTEDSYITAKAMGITCPTIPTRGFMLDTMNPGGMPFPVLVGNPNYHPQPVVQMMQNEPRPSYTAPNPNPALDRGFEREMRK